LYRYGTLVGVDVDSWIPLRLGGAPLETYIGTQYTVVSVFECG
jgi:hypothetical protein